MKCPFYCTVMYKEISFKWKWNPGHSFQHFVSLLFLNLSRDLFCTEVGVFAYIQLQNHASINIPGSFPALPTPCHRDQTGNSAKLRLLKKHVLYKYKLNDWIISSLEWVLKGPSFIRLSLSLSQNSQTQFSIMCLICENPIKHIFIQKLKNKLQKLKKYLTWPDWLIGKVPGDWSAILDGSSWSVMLKLKRRWCTAAAFDSFRV